MLYSARDQDQTGPAIDNWAQLSCTQYVLCTLPENVNPAIVVSPGCVAIFVSLVWRFFLSLHCYTDAVL